MSDKTFVDTNILIYAHDVAAAEKHRIANLVLRGLWVNRTGVVSLQVLQEFYVNATRKIAKPLSKHEARRVIDTYLPWCADSQPEDLHMAFRIQDETSVNFWDALILASAQKAGATRVLTEDLNPGQRIAGVLIENPFMANR